MPRVSHPTLTAALAALPAAVLAMALAACGSGSPQAASPTRTVSQQPGPASDSTPTAASTPTSTQPISTQPTTALPGGTPSPGGRPPAGTGLSGRTVVVNCPVDRADPPCPGTPVPAHVVVLDRTGQTTAGSRSPCRREATSSVLSRPAAAGRCARRSARSRSPRVATRRSPSGSPMACVADPVVARVAVVTGSAGLRRPAVFRRCQGGRPTPRLELGR
jgi:hypothetical protein